MPTISSSMRSRERVFLKRATSGSSILRINDMLPNRLRISRHSADTVKLLKSRTGLTPNLRCRVALTLSLEGGHTGGEQPTDLEGSEFNLPTLFGEHVTAYECLLRHVHGVVEGRALNFIVAAHIDNGL